MLESGPHGATTVTTSTCSLHLLLGIKVVEYTCVRSTLIHADTHTGMNGSGDACH